MTIALRSLALVLATVLGVGTGRAQTGVCGDGAVDAGEGCDAGAANGASVSCCTATCAPRAAGETCRAATDPCDVGETCDGVASTCPVDVSVPDGDDDGICDPFDSCPSTADPEQADDDGDGRGNACDPCTNVVPTIARKAVLKISKLLTGPGDDRLKLKLTAEGVPSQPTLDPLTQGLRFLLTDALGRTIIDARLPGGQYASDVRAGWKGSGAGWSYANGGQVLPLIQGLTKVTVKGRPTRPGMLSIAVVGKKGSYAVAADGLPLLATVVLDPPVAVTGQCVDVSFTDPSGCLLSTNGSVICK